MQVDGVRGVFFSTEFVTVSKEEAAEWPTLKPLVFAEIMDFYASGDAIIGEEGEAADSLAIDEENDSEVVQMIKELLDMRIRPSVQEDGGDIVYKGFDEEAGVVLLQMQGSCSGCPKLVGHAQERDREHADALHPRGERVRAITEEEEEEAFSPTNLKT